MAAPPAALVAPCRDPVDIPERAMSAGEVERAMAANIVSLLDCKERKEAETAFYAHRDAALAGVKMPK